MTYRISISVEADAHLRSLKPREQRLLEEAIRAKLTERPATPTRSIKRLRPNPLVEFELRVGELRVLYNVEVDEVIILVIGRKVREKLIVRGAEFHGHQDNPPQ